MFDQSLNGGPTFRAPQGCSPQMRGGDASRKRTAIAERWSEQRPDNPPREGCPGTLRRANLALVGNEMQRRTQPGEGNGLGVRRGHKSKNCYVYQMAGGPSGRIIRRQGGCQASLDESGDYSSGERGLVNQWNVSP